MHQELPHLCPLATRLPLPQPMVLPHHHLLLPLHQQRLPPFQLNKLVALPLQKSGLPTGTVWTLRVKLTILSAFLSRSLSFRSTKMSHNSLCIDIMLLLMHNLRLWPRNTKLNNNHHLLNSSIRKGEKALMVPFPLHLVCKMVPKVLTYIASEMLSCCLLLFRKISMFRSKSN